MSHYTYTAFTTSGEEITESVEAVNRAEVYALAAQKGLQITTITEAITKKNKELHLPKWLQRVKEQEKITFAKNLSNMLGAGLPLARSLEVMKNQSKNPKTKEVLGNIQTRIGKGETLSSALKAHPKVFSNLMTAMVRAGEESGSLAESLNIVGEQMEKTYVLKKRVKGAFIYPAVILCVMVVIAILMMMFVVPTLTQTFKDVGADLPITTQIVIAISDTLKNHPIISLGSMLVAVIGVGYFFRTTYGQRLLDKILLRLPVIGTMTREVNAARTTRTISSLLASGVDMVMSLEITRDVLQNHKYAEVMNQAKDRVQQGESVAAVVADYPTLYPAFVTEMASVGEETGQLSEMLVNVATYYEREVEQKTKDLSTIIEPVLMVVIGLAVGFFAVYVNADVFHDEQFVTGNAGGVTVILQPC